ncbi:hypothetical protein DWV00_29670 [Trinickia dinghuensis]|uniref:Uncharacterized protein n=2 Tax=Trinickia dinghuensis TaxID=2291023 RepID=A0A3D8JQ77_9BURK|nr:hypothetical protein DWV00_29670 [Trinickia dinghuensis]
MGATRRIAVSAVALSTVADTFRLTLADVTREAAGKLIDVVPSNTGALRNFGLETALGQVEALFDHAFKDEQLVGRYRFFMVEKTATGDVEAREFWAVLFDANYNATWDPEANYGWTFMPGSYDTPAMMGRFALALLAKIQARIKKYDTKF